MSLSRRSFVAAAAAALAGAPAAQAEPGALRLVFPFPAGGGADSLLRLVAELLRARLDRAVVVENVTGAGGRVGLRAVKEAPADGRTLLFTSSGQMVLQPHLLRQPGWDPFADFVPLAAAARFDQALAVAAGTPAHTVAELIALARREPALASFGTPGVGTFAQFVGIELARLSGVELRHVPYRGTPPALGDLTGGRLGLVVASLGELLEQHRGGRLRVVATTGAERSDLIGGTVPSLREAGYDIVASGHFAFYAPAGLPAAAAARLTPAIAAVLATPEVAARRTALGLQAPPQGDLAAIERREHARWGAIVQASGFQPEG